MSPYANVFNTGETFTWLIWTPISDLTKTFLDQWVKIGCWKIWIMCLLHHPLTIHGLVKRVLKSSVPAPPCCAIWSQSLCSKEADAAPPPSVWQSDVSCPWFVHRGCIVPNNNNKKVSICRKKKIYFVFWPQLALLWKRVWMTYTGANRSGASDHQLSAWPGMSFRNEVKMQQHSVRVLAMLINKYNF